MVILRAEVSQFGLENAASAAAEVGAVSEALDPSLLNTVLIGSMDFCTWPYQIRKSQRKIRKIVQAIQWVGKCWEIVNHFFVFADVVGMMMMMMVMMMG